MTITEELRATIDAAIQEAKERRHEYITLEHLLYALCADPVARKIFKATGVNLKTLVSDLEGFFEQHLEPLPEDPERDPKQTVAFWRVLQRAAMHVQGSGKTKVDASNVLIALFREVDSHAIYLLKEQDVTRLDVTRFVSHGFRKPGPDDRALTRRNRSHDDDDETASDDEKDPLEAFTTNLNALAAAGRIDPLVGRKDELRLVIQALARRRKNNPVLVGDPGVGKTAIIEGLALAIHEKTVPELLEGHTVYCLDMGALLAGTKFRGEFEERLKGVIKAITDDDLAILFIDEIHTIVGAGAVSGGSMDASNLLKPALQSGRLRCIGSTTYPEYKAAFERDRALARRFQKIEIVEPSVEESIEILKGLQGRYEAHHKVKFTDDAVRSAAELSAKYINERRLPDKAIDIIDQAGAANRLYPKNERKKQLGDAEIETVVATIAKIPEKSVSRSDAEALVDLESSLKAVIFGQDKAIEAISSAIKLSRAGLGPEGAPIGSFLFSGPTGVGKTELAKQLAAVLGIQFCRFDMSEYMEKHTVSRLIGAPPGYVGFDQGGLLTDAIRKTPYAVLLLDEIEKAHPDVFNILLQVMDHATLTDNNGRKADFRHVILIMTTNAGGRELSSLAMGFSPGNTSTELRSKSEIERVFSPEFRNRLDAWVAFSALGTDVVELIVDKMVGELQGQLKDKAVSIRLTGDARSWLGVKGYDVAFGARPMRRLIQNELKKPLAERILFGDLKDGGAVLVSEHEGQLLLERDPDSAKPEDQGGAGLAKTDKPAATPKALDTTEARSVSAEPPETASISEDAPVEASKAEDQPKAAAPKPEKVPKDTAPSDAKPRESETDAAGESEDAAE